MSDACRTVVPELLLMVMMFTGSAELVVKFNCPEPFCSAICELSTVTDLPTTPVAWITSLPCVAWMREVRLELVVICCSTLLNWTNSVVKVLVSIGEDGSWFCNWVSNSPRKLVKLLLSDVSAFAEDDDELVAALDAALVIPELAAEVSVGEVMEPDMAELLQAVMSTPARSQAAFVVGVSVEAVE